MAPKRKLFDAEFGDASEFMKRIGLEGLEKQVSNQVCTRRSTQLVQDFIKNMKNNGASRVGSRKITLSASLFSTRLGLSKRGVEIGDECVIGQTLHSDNEVFCKLGFSRSKREYQLSSLSDASLVPVFRLLVQLVEQKVNPTTISDKLLACMIFAYEGNVVNWAKCLCDRFKAAINKGSLVEAAFPMLALVLEKPPESDCDEEPNDQEAHWVATMVASRKRLITIVCDLAATMKDHILREQRLDQVLEWSDEQVKELHDANEELLCKVDDIREELMLRDELLAVN